MTNSCVLVNGFSLGAAAANGAVMLTFDGRAVIALRVEGTNEIEDITHASYIAGIDVYHSARAYIENRPLFRYMPHTKWHNAPVKNLVKDRGLARFEFEATGFRSADPGAPRLGRLRVAVGEDLRAPLAPRMSRLLVDADAVSHAG